MDENDRLMLKQIYERLNTIENKLEHIERILNIGDRGFRFPVKDESNHNFKPPFVYRGFTGA
jgi:hypothetical protein